MTQHVEQEQGSKTSLDLPEQVRLLAAWENVREALGGQARALRVLALGLWLAWFWAAFGFGLCNPALTRGIALWCPAAALACACGVFLLCSYTSDLLERGASRRMGALAPALVAAVCSAPLPLAETVRFDPALSAVACCVCGASAAWLLMLCAKSDGVLAPVQNFIAFLASWLVAALAYVLITSLSGLVSAVVFAAAVLLCGASLAVAGGASEPVPQPQRSSALAAEEARMSRFELLFGLGVFFFTIGFVRSTGLAQATGPANFHIGATPAAALFALYAVVGIALALRGRMTLGFVRSCYAFASLGLAFATMTMALTDTGGASVRTLTDVAYLALLPAVWCAAGAGASVHGRTVGNAFGVALGVIAGAAAAGWFVQCAVAAVYAQRDAITTLLLGLGFLCFAYFMFGFPVTSFSSYLMRPEDRSPELAPLDVGPGAAEEHRGISFREGVGLLADKASLSKREREVLLLLAKGLSNERIAEELVISYHTVRAHVRNIYSKLEVHNRQELLERIEEIRRVEQG